MVKSLKELLIYVHGLVMLGFIDCLVLCKLDLFSNLLDMLYTVYVF